MTASYPLLYTIGIFSFFLTSVERVIPALGGPNIRWIVLVGVTTVTGLVALTRSVTLPRQLAICLALFWLYPLLTAMWSENPNLTMTKWLVFVLVSSVFLFGGFVFIERSTSPNPFAPLAPLYALGVGPSLLALWTQPEAAFASGLFQGYVNGPNMLGAMITLSSPWLVVEIRRRWHDPAQRAVWLSFAFAGLVVLLMTRSRASMLLLLVMLSCTLLVLPRTQRIIAGSVLGLALLSSYWLYPEFYTTSVQTYVYKSGPTVLFTREEAFAVSLEKAREGGNFGVGFGISSGESWDWSFETTSVGFGREKGNSQLAVLEEMGVVGFALYCLLVGAISTALIGLGRQYRYFGGDPFYYYVTLGFFFGTLAHSVFEAWFTAPGSAEAAVFWAGLGLGLGTLSKMPASE